MGKTSLLKYYGLGHNNYMNYYMNYKNYNYKVLTVQQRKRKNSILKMNIYGILASDLGVIGNLHEAVGESLGFEGNLA